MLQREAVWRAAGPRAGLHVVSGVQHQPARLLARVHVPQDAARRQPRAPRHTGHTQQREYFVQFFFRTKYIGVTFYCVGIYLLY